MHKTQLLDALVALLDRVDQDSRQLDRLTNSPDTPQLSRHASFQARHARSHLHQAVLELMRLQQILKGEAK